MLLRTKSTAFGNETRYAKQVRRVGDNKKRLHHYSAVSFFLLWNEIILQHLIQV